MFRYVIKSPGSPAMIREVSHDVDTFSLCQQLVGGKIESLTLLDLEDIENRGVSFFINDDGKFDSDLPAHCILRSEGVAYDVVFGAIVAFGYDSTTGDTISLASDLAVYVASGLDRLVAMDSPEKIYEIGNAVLDALGADPRDIPPHLAASLRSSI